MTLDGLTGVIIEGHGGDDDETLDNGVVGRRNIQEIQAIIDKADQQGAEERSLNRAFSTEKTGSPDDDGADDVDFVTFGT